MCATNIGTIGPRDLIFHTLSEELFKYMKTYWPILKAANNSSLNIAVQCCLVVLYIVLQ